MYVRQDRAIISGTKTAYLDYVQRPTLQGSWRAEVRSIIPRLVNKLFAKNLHSSQY